jgi:Fur family ferric uptake transcriptional regulator
MAQAWDEELRARGYRVTPQRQLVLEAVTKLEHATPEAICADVQLTARGVNISTIYRTLELLEQLGLVTHTHLGHGAPRYHLAAEAEHVHLVCSQCGRVTQIGPEAVNALVAALKDTQGFETLGGERLRRVRREPMRRLRRRPRSVIQNRLPNPGP